jgi:TonB-linked SusC/RagA family outer membrane protein
MIKDKNVQRKARFAALHQAVCGGAARRSLLLLAAVLLTASTSLWAQNLTVSGTVLDVSGAPVVGASVVVKGSTTGVTTNVNGGYTISVPPDATLVFSYLGMKSKEIKATSNELAGVVLEEEEQLMQEVVVVGYGQQKKASVVGSITQTSGKVLERAGGVTNLGAALTGNLPGVITSASTGMPGDEQPQIIIRTQSSWNSSAPLVLVDGVEREMSAVDISSVESISVLKDASATAVYGVKGANGVILITTKRGKEGKANIQVKANMTAKAVSKLPEKYDSYATFLLLNQAIEREAAINSAGWADYTPKPIVDKYRYPANTEEWDRYPNVDWEDYMFKDYAMSYNASVNVSGGTSLVKYFSAVDWVHEGDMFEDFENGRGYDVGFGYNRINARSNLDFELTKTTNFSVNLFGSNDQRTVPWNQDAYKGDYASTWTSVYKSAPDAMRPVYSNGMWGWYAPRNADVPNSAYNLATSGQEILSNTRLTTDFILDQDLKMLVSGLSFKGRVSMDYRFLENQRGINDLYNGAQRMWVNPETGDIALEHPIDAGTQLDWQDGIEWSGQAGSADVDKTYRKIYYSFQLDYARTFGRHEVTALGLFSRSQDATGSVFPYYREDWVFRTTYNYAMRYFAEINGAYNGSEKFGPDYRFAFFPSFSAGWMLSEEAFMKPLSFIDMFKLRASWGRIGDDNVSGRWLYQDQWTYGGNTLMGSTNPENTPYTYYKISSLGNPDISWETVEKRNVGLDYSFLNGMVAGAVDIFNDTRTDIIVQGSQRAIASYYGATAPSANLGKVNSKGYELELRLSYVFRRGVRIWANMNMTHAENKTIFRDDAQLTPAYQKQAGYAIGQTTSYIDYGNLQSWDDILGSTPWNTNNANKLPGDYNVIDFNGDGVIDNYDRAPYQYCSMPQNTYNASLGFDYKGFSCFVQLYGVNNVTREVRFPTFQSTAHVAYSEGDYWSKEGSATLPMPRWATTIDESGYGTRYWYDGSFLRLKNAEVSYAFKESWVKRWGVSVFRLYLNGDNLLLWTKMPDDRESNFSGSSTTGAYPTVRRFNLGIDLTF